MDGTFSPYVFYMVTPFQTKTHGKSDSDYHAVYDTERIPNRYIFGIASNDMRDKLTSV